MARAKQFSLYLFEPAETYAGGCIGIAAANLEDALLVAARGDYSRAGLDAIDGAAPLTGVKVSRRGGARVVFDHTYWE